MPAGIVAFHGCFCENEEIVKALQFIKIEEASGRPFFAPGLNRIRHRADVPRLWSCVAHSQEFCFSQKIKSLPHGCTSFAAIPFFPVLRPIP